MQRFVPALVFLCATGAAAQTTIVTSSMSVSISAAGSGSADTDPITATTNWTDEEVTTTATMTLDSVTPGGFRLIGRSDGQQLLAPEPTGTVAQAFVRFTLTTASFVTLAYDLTSATFTGNQATNYFNATLQRVSGPTLLSFEFENRLTTGTGSGTVELLPGDYTVSTIFDTSLGVVGTASSADIGGFTRLTAVPVPEPATLAVLGLGLTFTRRRRNRG